MAAVDIKEFLISRCDALRKVYDEKAVEYGEDIGSRIDELKQSIAEHRFKVYLVGPFSCGKSSLLNRWLGSRILSAGLAPETAVSSELLYGDRERMILQPLDVSKPNEVLEGINEENMVRVRERANAGELANVVLYLDNPRLKEYSDLCLVDLPGLSSANPAHEAALERFIRDRHKVAIFCSPMGDGTIHGDSLAFMRRIGEDLRLEFDVLLTKADERSASDHAKIAEVVGRELRRRGFEAKVGKVSKDSISDFEKLIDGYRERKDEYFRYWFGAAIKDIAEEMLYPLRRALSANFDNSAIESALEKIEATEKELPSIADEMRANMKRQAESAVNDINMRLRESIKLQQASLMARASSSGGESCVKEVASLIKTKLADLAPDALGSIMESAGRDAGRKLDSTLDFDLDAGDIIDVPSEEVGGELVPAVPTQAEPAPQNEQKGFFAKCFESGFNLSVAGAALGDVVFPGVGAMFGAGIGSLVGIVSEYMNEEDENSKQEAEFAMKLDEACRSTEGAVKERFNSAVEKCGRRLEEAIAEKMAAMHAQVAQLKSEAAAGKAEWESRQEVRREAEKRLNAIAEEFQDGNV